MGKYPDCWNLDELYTSFDAPEFVADYNGALESAKVFAEKYKGTLGNLAKDDKKFFEFIAEYEQLLGTYYRLHEFVSLRFSANTRDDDAVKWQAQVRERLSEAENSLIFVMLEIQALDDTMLQKLIASLECGVYKHFIERVLDFKPHTLSEEVEQVLNEMNTVGRSAFVELRTLHLGSQEFEPLTTPDGKTVDTEAGLSSLLMHPNRETRRQAYRNVRKVYKEHNMLYGYILQKVAQNHKIVARRRKYTSSLEAELLGDEVPRKVFDKVMKVTLSNFDLFRNYYDYKRAKLGLDHFSVEDLYAPMAKIEREYTWDEAVELVYSAMSQADTEFLSIVQNFVEKSYVDAEVRKGKRGGAFCSSIYGFHPYVLMSFTGNISEVFTLAHELGHGIHSVFTNRNQKLLSSDYTLVIAEIASTFSELLLLDYLLSSETDADTKKALICHQMEDALNLFFRQTTISRLECDFHDRAAAGSFDHKFVNEKWEWWYKELCGSVVEIPEEHKYDWARIGHIFFKPFYCYTYCLSFMASMACFLAFKKEGAAFIPKFKQVLSVGGSLSPEQTLNIIGIDLTDEKVLQGAIDYHIDLLEKLKALG